MSSSPTSTSSSTSTSKARQTLFGRCAVSSSQPLASAVGLKILQSGGCATDAAIAMAAMLSVTEPTSNGIGGDFVALHHDHVSNNNGNCGVGKTTSILGIGRSPHLLKREHFDPRPLKTSAYTVTVPGVVKAWYDMHERCGGLMSMEELLTPAINVAKHGFFVQRTTAKLWMCTDQHILQHTSFEQVPKYGDLFKNEGLADCLLKIVKQGPDVFYKGEIAQRIVEQVQHHNGVLSMKDMEEHETEFEEALEAEFESGWSILECGIPTQGAVALVALNILREYRNLMRENEDSTLFENIYSTNERVNETHVLIECIRIAFFECSKCIGDSTLGKQLLNDLLKNDEHIRLIASHIDVNKKYEINWNESEVTNRMIREWDGGTVQFCVIDKNGNGVSAVQSNYQGFGTGIEPKGCGFILQNRGLNFNSQTPGHVNFICGSKRPYHTIMPGMMLNKFEHDTLTTFGVMGSFMQPQGHLQVIYGLVCKLYDAQSALDCSRFRVTGPFSKVEAGMEHDQVLVEDDIEQDIVDGLKGKGHDVIIGDMEVFGRGHVCKRDKHRIVSAGADVRADGMAMVWI